jgi:hypothetical protein
VKTEAPLLPGFKLDQTFFGFNVKDRVKLHKNLFDMMWHGEGRWDWNTVYNMPVFLRNFWIDSINKILQPKPTNKKNLATMPVPVKS